MTIFAILLIVGFVWLTTRDLKWRFISGIIAGVLLIVFKPSDSMASVGVVLIIGCTVWLLLYNSLTKKNKI